MSQVFDQQSGLYCPDENRKAIIRAAGVLNGIDYLEVLDTDARPGNLETAHIAGSLPAFGRCAVGVKRANQRRGQNHGDSRCLGHAGPRNCSPCRIPRPSNRASNGYLSTHCPTRRRRWSFEPPCGDFSTYNLQLVASGVDSSPPAGFDRLLCVARRFVQGRLPDRFRLAVRRHPLARLPTHPFRRSITNPRTLQASVN